MTPAELSVLANQFRVQIIQMISEAKSGHPGGSLSAIDILTVLWFAEMRGVEHAPAPTNDPNRDRFVLSKGHGVPALYAILAKKGFIREDELGTLRKTGSRLQGHPDRVRLPIVEASTGSLGQGLSIAQGLALGLKLDGRPSRVFCMIGDGESQEGQIWEAAMSAPKFKLSNLCVILDQNGGQIDGPVKEVMPIEPVAEKWRSFGWHVIEINGHDFGQIASAFQEFRGQRDKPTFIVAHTIKGKGVSFMENQIGWHGVAPKPDEAARAIDEIRKGAH